MGQIVSMRDKSKNMRTAMEKWRPRMRALLPKTESDQYYIECAMLEVAKEPKLLDCTEASLYKCVLQATKMALPIGELAHLIPFKNEARLIPNYQGIMEMAYRTGRVRMFWASTVYAEDDFDIEEGSARRIHHRPNYAAEDRGEFIGAYACCELTDGTTHFRFCPRQEIEKAMDFAKAKSGPWYDWFDSMACKTAAKRLCKWVPKSVLGAQLQRAIQLDDAAESKTRAVYDYDIEVAAEELEPKKGSKLEQFNEAHGVEQEPNERPLTDEEEHQELV